MTTKRALAIIGVISALATLAAAIKRLQNS